MAELCRSCDAEIVWAILPSGKAIPLDAQPVPDGNIAALRDHRGNIQARALPAPWMR